MSDMSDDFSYGGRCALEEDEYIRCIGVDGKQHICEPHENTCYCGVHIKTKKLQRDDYERLSCYECTF